MNLVITFEGVNGSGKTTIIKELQNRIIKDKSYYFDVNEVYSFRCPGDGIPEIRDIFKNPDNHFQGITDLFLACADMSELVYSIEKIRRMESNSIILIDRFIDSTFVYQQVYGNVDPGIIESCTSLATRGMRADLTLVFDIPFEVSEERRKGEGFKDRFEKDFETKFEELRQKFLDRRNLDPSRIKIIEGSRTISNVLINCINLIRDLLDYEDTALNEALPY